MLKKILNLGTSLNKNAQKSVNAGNQCVNANDCIDLWPREPKDLWLCVNGFCQQW